MLIRSKLSFTDVERYCKALRVAMVHSKTCTAHMHGTTVVIRNVVNATFGGRIINIAVLASHI